MCDRFMLLIATGVLLAGVAGCGGGNSTMATNASPTPGPPPVSATPLPSPQPTPPPSPSPSPSPTPGAPNPQMYMIHMVTVTAPPQSDVGQLTVNAAANDGSGTLTLQNVDASKMYTLNFCPQSGQGSNCIGLGSFTSDASGSATFHFKFPQTGTWAGQFTVTGGSVPIADGFFSGATAGPGFQAPLFPVHSLTTGLAYLPPPDGGALGNEPLDSGELSINHGVVTVTLEGAAPNTAYSAAYVLGYAPYGGSSDYGTNQVFTTDASGNGSGNFTDLFGGGTGAWSVLSIVTDNNGLQYVAGFRVQ